MESEAMRELRGIRDENSQRHLRMTREECHSEAEDCVLWFQEKMAQLAARDDLAA